MTLPKLFPWWVTRNGPTTLERYLWPRLDSTHSLAQHWLNKDLTPSDQEALPSPPRDLSPDTWIWLRAQTQRAGRGQGNKAYFSPPGGLYITLVCLWPNVTNPPPLSLLTALAVAETLDFLMTKGTESTPHSCTLKWVNDVFLGGSKISGILIERHWGTFFSPCIISIGINVNNMGSHTPEGRSITSLAKYTGRTWDMEELLKVLERRLWTHYRDTIMLDGMLGEEARRSLKARLQEGGQKVQITTPQGVFSGYFQGIAPSGGIILDSGQEYDALSLCILHESGL